MKCDPRATDVSQQDATIMKIATIIGARPQFIKAAVVSRAVREYCPDVCEVLIHTGQHDDASMSDVFFGNSVFPPKFPENFYPSLMNGQADKGPIDNSYGPISESLHFPCQVLAAARAKAR